jgi:hypothetical protein
MLNENTRVLDNDETRGASFFRCLIIRDSKLHPNGLGPELNRAFYNRRDLFASPKDIHNLNRFWNVLKARVAPLSQNFLLVRIYRNDFVTLRLHISSHAVARPGWIRGQTHDA